MEKSGYGKQKQIASLTAKYAMSKIIPLQMSYLGSNNASSARVRATLARLRRLNAATGTSWFSAGDQLFDQWPCEELTELGASNKDEDRMARTLEAVLGLYAIHQQSSGVGRAVVRRKDEPDEGFSARCRAASFGKCCRKIKADLSEASGVRNRLAAIEAASDFEGILYGVRGLIRLMRSSDDLSSQPLDYYALTQDLYLLQTSDSAKDKVFSRWSKDYFSRIG